MEHDELQALLETAEAQLFQINETVAQLTFALKDLSEVNNRLRIRNQDLVEMLTPRSNDPAQLNSEHSSAEEQDYAPSGKDRLQTFYDEGIHVCHPYFGSRRMPAEECMFCQGVLDGLEDE